MSTAARLQRIDEKMSEIAAIVSEEIAKALVAAHIEFEISEETAILAALLAGQQIYFPYMAPGIANTEERRAAIPTGIELREMTARALVDKFFLPCIPRLVKHFEAGRAVRFYRLPIPRVEADVVGVHGVGYIPLRMSRVYDIEWDDFPCRFDLLAEFISGEKQCPK